MDSKGEKKVIAGVNRVSRKCETTTMEYIAPSRSSHGSRRLQSTLRTMSRLLARAKYLSACIWLRAISSGLLPAREKFMEKNSWYRGSQAAISRTGHRLVTRNSFQPHLLILKFVFLLGSYDEECENGREGFRFSGSTKRIDGRQHLAGLFKPGPEYKVEAMPCSSSSSSPSRMHNALY